MGIRVTEQSKERREYPKLMNIDQLVVLFYTRNCGTIIRCGENGSQLGSYHEDWDEKLFTPYIGRIILENE